MSLAVIRYWRFGLQDPFLESAPKRSAAVYALAGLSVSGVVGSAVPGGAAPGAPVRGVSANWFVTNTVSTVAAVRTTAPSTSVMWRPRRFSAGMALGEPRTRTVWAILVLTERVALARSAVLTEL